MSKPWKPRLVHAAPPGRRAFRKGRARRGPGPADALLFLLGGGAALGLSLVWRPAAEAGGGGAPPLEAASPRVIDGDTFDLSGTRIRIADIDTPEVHGRCAEESRLAARATERTRALLAAGPFALEPIPGRDEDVYGRKLRIVTRGGRSLGEVLVAEGLAHAWAGRKLGWCG